MNAFELMKGMIESGAAGVHFEDQLSSEKKCGHLGGKVLVPTGQFIRTLLAARLAADMLGVPTLLVARTDADAATLITSDADERDAEFITGERTPEGFYRVRAGVEAAIARGLAYAPYADLVWMETSTPDLGVAREFAEAIHAEFPGKLLAYNCSPSFNWRRHLDDETIERFQRELGAMGYKFQFITLAGFHALNESMFELARGYAAEGMPAYVRLQEREFALEDVGYTATKHQREVGAGWFDEIAQAVSGGASSTLALKGSTEEEQFQNGNGASDSLRLGIVPPPMEGGQPIRVLVVDDHQIFTHALTTVLGQDGRFEVVGTAATGREAVKAAKTTEADVVLMDMSMPVLDGPAATRRLLELDPAPCVIALSGHTDGLSRAAALEAGATAFVTKSEAFDELVATILQACGRE